jgi:hypothetical protein
VNHAPNAVLRTKPDPPQGEGPLTVIFDMCGSSDPDGDPLTFFFDFGDGNKTSGSSCVESHTYAAAFREAATGKVKALDASYTFQGSVVDPSLDSGSRSRTVVVTSAKPTCSSPPAPTVSAPNCQVQTGNPTNVTVNVTASDPQGISNVVVKGVNNLDYVAGSCSAPGSGSSVQTTASGSAPSFTATLPLTPPPSTGPPKCYQVGAIVTNSCGATSSNSTQTIIAAFSCYPVINARDVKESMAWSSDLDVEGGRLQVIVNGSAASYPDRGRAYGMAAFVDGANRVEATLVEGKGKAGVWRFEFLGTEGGSIHVLAGDVSTVAATSISFRLKGTPGERISFTFEKQ